MDKNTNREIGQWRDCPKQAAYPIHPSDRGHERWTAACQYTNPPSNMTNVMDTHTGGSRVDPKTDNYSDGPALPRLIFAWCHSTQGNTAGKSCQKGLQLAL